MPQEIRQADSTSWPRAKFDAWLGVKGTPANDAMQQYIDLVTSLQG